jgi:hypothetical protein
MLTNTGDMNTYAYKYKGYGHICLQIPGIHVGTHMLTNTGDMNTYAYKYQGYGHICLQIPGIWTHMLTKDKHFLLLIKGPYKSK